MRRLNTMERKSMTIAIAVVVAGLLVTAALSICETDAFQRQFFPKDYWQKQVRSSQWAIKLTRGTIRNTMIELEKLQMTAELDVAKQVNSAKLIGMDADVVRKIAVAGITGKAKFLREEIKWLNERLEEEEPKLDQAKEKLAQYQ